MIVRSLRLLPERFKFESERERGTRNRLALTFDRVGLDELRTVHKYCFGDSFP
jgi:hypothetical protein